MAEEVFRRMGEEQSAFALENDSLAILLPRWLEDKGNHHREMRAWELHKELSKLAKSDEVEFEYSNSRSLGQRLGNVEGSLHVILDVKTSYDKKAKQKTYSFSPKTKDEAAGIGG